MEGIMYPASLVVLAIIAFTFSQNNNSKLALVAILLGAYIVYSTETGNTATDFKNEMANSIEESAEDFTQSYDIDK